MKKVIIEKFSPTVVSIDQVNPDKTYVIEYKICGVKNRFGFIHALSYNGNEYETLSTESFTKGNRYQSKGALKQVIANAIRIGDQVWEFNQVWEALEYVTGELKKQ